MNKDVFDGFTVNLILDEDGDCLAHFVEMPNHASSVMTLPPRATSQHLLYYTQKEGIVSEKNVFENAELSEGIIQDFAEFHTTTQVVNRLHNDFVDYCEEHPVAPPEFRMDRNEIREKIRTLNPNNAKFNRAKWGELLDEYRSEYLSNVQNRMVQVADQFITAVQGYLEIVCGLESTRPPTSTIWRRSCSHSRPLWLHRRTNTRRKTS